MQDLADWFTELKARWWLYVLGYFAITSLIGFVLKFLFRNTNRIVLTVMFYPAIFTWRLIHRVRGRHAH